jgi:sodium transport system ATP-binding protein
MIEVRGLTKAFRAGGGATVQAVAGADWTAPDASITGLLGPNGAGKTTTLRVVAALIAPDAGRVTVGGIDVARDPLAVRARLGVLSDARGLYPRLTARENIVYHARLHGIDPATAHARADDLAALLDFASLIDRRAEGFSQGERMKIALARALVHAPSHLLLDEPTNGLDVPTTRALRETLRRLRGDAGTCIVFSSHLMAEVERLCDDVVVMSGGRTVAHGRVDELLERTGSRDFEQAFVALAYDGATGAAGAPAAAEASP